MITYTKETGCYFQMTADSRHYHLMEMMEYKGTKTSDIIAIWDFDNNALVGYHYGANSISVDELDEAVAGYVREYEAKQHRQTAEAERAAAAISYRFTREGVKLFCYDTESDILANLETVGVDRVGDPDTRYNNNFDFYVSCGSRYIRIPCGAEEYELLCDFLKDAWEVGEWE